MLTALTTPLALALTALPALLQDTAPTTRTVGAQSTPVVGMVAGPKGKVLYTLDKGREVQAWSLAKEELLWKTPALQLSLPAVGITLGTDAVGVCLGPPIVQEFDLDTGETAPLGIGHIAGWGTCVAGDTKQRRFWVGSRQGNVTRVLPGQEGGLELPIGTGISSLYLHPGGKTLFVGGQDGTVRFVKAKSGSVDDKEVFKEHGAPVTAITQDAKGRYVFSGDDKGELRIWRGPGKASQLVVRAHEGGIRTIVCDPKGKWFATGSAAGEIKIWPFETKGEIEPVFTHRSEKSEPVVGLLALDKGKTLASAGPGERITLWDLSVLEL